MTTLPPTLLLLACLVGTTALGAAIGACVCRLLLARRAPGDAAPADDALRGAMLERRVREQAQRIVVLETELYARTGRRVPRPRDRVERREGGRRRAASSPRTAVVTEDAVADVVLADDEAALPVLKRRVGGDVRPPRRVSPGGRSDEAPERATVTVARFPSARDRR